MIRRANSGFTLVEIMVVMAIIALLAAVALPSYQDSIRKTRRSDAKVTMLRLEAEQERWYFVRNQYTTTLSDILDGTDSDEGYYTLSVVGTGTACTDTDASTLCDNYRLTAQATGSQADDTACPYFHLYSSGQKTSSTDSDDSTPTTIDCWD